MDETSSDLENVSHEESSTDITISDDESFLVPPGGKKKVPQIISDTSEDESFIIEKNSYESGADTSSKDESFNNTSTNLCEKADETDLSQNILNDSTSQLGMHEPVLNKLDRTEYGEANSSNIMTPRGLRAVIDSDKEDELNDSASHSNVMKPRTVKAVIDSDSEDDIVEASFDDEDDVEYIPSARKLPQKNLIKSLKDFAHTDQALSHESQTIETSILNSEDELTTMDEYLNQKKKVQSLESDLQKLKTTLRTLNLSVLPDGGEMLVVRLSSLESALQTAQDKLFKMKVKEELPAQMKPVVSWDQLQAASTTVQPKTFGIRAMATYNAQKALTMDRLHQLHGSIETCPTEDTLATDPRGLRVELMEHQKQALAWLMWRQNQKPSGGILADDMGLGKTLTMIALMLKQRELQDLNDSSEDEENIPHNRRHKYNGGTLIICPASLLRQWEDEVKKHCKRYLLSVEPYHGPKRETRAKSLAKYDMVITTYSICMNEFGKSTPINTIYWRQIILDEAHQIKNFKCTTSKAVCELSAKSRWVLTGTPVHNKELDMYSLLKFLRCSPFDDITVWKRWVSDKNHGGQERLHTVLSSLMLRRTKQQLQEKGALTCLPDRQWELIEITLTKAETNVYQKILIFSRTLFAQFLHQRAEKETDYRESFDYANVYKGNAEYHKMHKTLLKLNKVKTVKQHDILMLLLRLRQICCHPSLITGMLQDEDRTELDGDEEHQDELNILEQLNKLNMDDDFDGALQNLSINDDKENDSLAQNCRTLLNPTNPVFGQQYKSSKIQTVIKKIKECVLQNNDKGVVVSQFTSFLKIIAIHLKEENIFFQQLDGSVPVLKRKDIVADFNNLRHPTKILLLSLTAGGVGLNLTGGNHLFLLDLHWNPQLELQAQDRIYRVGQVKPVYVYKFITADTIEQRIKQLQEKKLELANSMLTGAKLQQTKLSIEDLKMLFNM